mmetsp:Transcript_12930/g.35125  ORF Transcript_12930/g.35125 Transcript_12930/m.35125 type:complete len:291 (+) Transcript_12930:216-1088(+)
MAGGVHGPDTPGSGAKPPPDPPSRFVCQSCGICIGTSDALLETKDDVLVFGRLHTSECSLEKGTKTVACWGCAVALGTRGEGSFALRRDRVARRSERLEILVCSLKQQEISDVALSLREAFPYCNITPRVLLKAELRGFQLPVARPGPELVVVVHRNEGRALLTDRNGFYHDVLGSAWPQTRGNVLVVLTRAAPKVEGDLFDQAMLRSLSTQGDQPTIGVMSSLGRVLTWDSAPSQAQLRQLQMLTSKAYFREPSGPAPQGMPATWCKPPQKAAGASGTSASSSGWCALL